MLYLANAFSLNMLEVGDGIELIVYPLSINDVKNLLSKGFKSIVGHPDTAAILSNMLGITVQENRETVKLLKGDELVVGQYIGPRLAPGTTTLPEGATIQFYLVRIK